MSNNNDVIDLSDEKWAMIDVADFYAKSCQIVDNVFGEKYVKENPMLIAELVKSMVFAAASLRENNPNQRQK